MQLGTTTVSVISVIELQVDIAKWFGLKQGDWPTELNSLMSHPVALPIQTIHIALPGRSIIIDPCHPELLDDQADPAQTTVHPTLLLEQLAHLGIDQSAIDTVIITHRHYDHYCGATIGAAPGHDRALFPHATYWIGKADWQYVQMQADANTAPALQPLMLLDRLGMVRPVEGPIDLGDGVHLLPTPGETAGHLAVRVEAQGVKLYALGDLYHHAIEVEHAEWGVTWADPQTTSQSRTQIVTAALAEHALLIATHIPGIGRIDTTATGHHWVPVATNAG